MGTQYISSVSQDYISGLCGELEKNNSIKPGDFQKYRVKRGLRNPDGTGVMAGLSHVSSVEGIIFLITSVSLKRVNSHIEVMTLKI